MKVAISSAKNLEAYVRVIQIKLNQKEYFQIVSPHFIFSFCCIVTKSTNFMSISFSSNSCVVNLTSFVWCSSFLLLQIYFNESTWSYCYLLLWAILNLSARKRKTQRKISREIAYFYSLASPQETPQFLGDNCSRSVDK